MQLKLTNRASKITIITMFPSERHLKLSFIFLAYFVLVYYIKLHQNTLKAVSIVVKCGKSKKHGYFWKKLYKTVNLNKANVGHWTKSSFL